MLKEALEFLAKTITTGNAAKVLPIPGDGRKVYVDQAGELRGLDIPPSVRGHLVETVTDLVAAAERWGKEGVIFINSDAVTLVTDDSDRRDTVILPLRKSHAFQTLERLDKTPSLDQVQFIRLLRIDLQGAANRADLLTAVRKIKFRQSSAGESNVQHGSESLGRTIENEVSGAGNIPEQLAVTCSVFANPGLDEIEHSVMCDLEIVATESKFRFRPLPDELADVQSAALAEIHGQLMDKLDSIGIFYGTP